MLQAVVTFEDTVCMITTFPSLFQPPHTNIIYFIFIGLKNKLTNMPSTQSDNLRCLGMVKQDELYALKT